MTTDQTPGTAALDRSDERVRHEEGMTGAFLSFVDRVRSGDLGMLPVVVGLILISVVFSSLNPVFLAPNNLVNLLFDCATVGVISLGIVCVLMLGEIDLSVGSMSGFASALVGVLWVKHGLAGRRGDCRRRSCRHDRRRDLCVPAQSAGYAELHLVLGGLARHPRHAALHSRTVRFHQPALCFGSGIIRPDIDHAGVAFSLFGAGPRTDIDSVRPLPQCAAAARPI